MKKECCMKACRISRSSCLVLPFWYAFLHASTIFVLQIIQALTPALYAMLTASIVDRVSSVVMLKSIAPVMPALIGLFIVIVFQFGFNTLQGYMYSALNAKVRMSFDHVLLKKVSRLEYRMIEDKDSYELCNRILQQYDTCIIKGFRAYMRMINCFVQLCSIISIMLFSQAWVAFVFLLLSTIPLVLISIKSGRQNYTAYVQSAVKEHRAQYYEELLTGKNAAQERLLFGYSEWLRHKWEEQYSESQRIKIQAQIKETVRTKFGSVLTVLVAVSVCGLMIPNLMAGTMSLGIFFGLTGAIFNFVTLMSWEVADTFNQLVQSTGFSEDLSSFFALKEGYANIAHTAMRNGKSKDVTIKFENVSFKYPGQDNYVLRDVCLEFEPHKHYALVGPNGAGKSTLIKLLLGLYTEYEGKITFNDVDIREMHCDEVFDNIAVAYQDFAKYCITFKEYFAMGRKQPLCDEEILSMLQRLDVDVAVNVMPKGLDTPLGRMKSDGQQVSQGQWQRIMVARTLLNNAPVKVFDEPTSAIDPIGESLLFQRIDEIVKGETALFITHRLGAAKMADIVIVLENGRICETGSFDQLLQMQGLFTEMYETQKEWYSFDSKMQ